MQASLERGWLGMGSDVAAFEAGLAGLVGAENGRVVAVSTGHAALHLSLMLAEVGSGDEVITASFNNIADLQAILATGAHPVFCDVDERTLCIDASRIESLIGPRTKAIIAMDYACHLCDHDAIAAIARRHGLRVVHDAAHALGSSYKGRRIGSVFDLTTFSFDPVKTITTIDGGAIVIGSDDEVARLREMRLIGMGQPASIMYRNQRAWTYDVKRLGFRYHLANAHAAIGVAQLAKFDRIAATRRATFARYAEALAGMPGLLVPQTDLAPIVPFIFYVRALDGRREALREHMKERGIDTGIHWQPGHWFTLFRDCRHGGLDVTERIGREILTIPFHSAMQREAEDRVIEAIRTFSR